MSYTGGDLAAEQRDQRQGKRMCCHGVERRYHDAEQGFYPIDSSRTLAI
jgi:hypothetical protein